METRPDDLDFVWHGPPGRVYAVKPDESKGERGTPDGTKGLVELLVGSRWRRFPGVTRIEFDNDADTGRATVEAFFMVDGQPRTAPGGELVKVRFRDRARITLVPTGEPLPEPIYAGSV